MFTDNELCIKQILLIVDERWGAWAVAILADFFFCGELLMYLCYSG
jgi:hypothetical protein